MNTKVIFFALLLGIQSQILFSYKVHIKNNTDTTQHGHITLDTSSKECKKEKIPWSVKSNKTVTVDSKKCCINEIVGIGQQKINNKTHKRKLSFAPPQKDGCKDMSIGIIKRDELPENKKVTQISTRNIPIVPYPYTMTNTKTGMELKKTNLEPISSGLQLRKK